MEELTLLGRKVEAPRSPEEAVLERVPAPASSDFCARFTCPEVTSLCPVTGQPDFAHFVIDYVPNGWLVESKSLKLFMNSFRNHRGFHEAITMMVVDRLMELLAPQWLRVGAYWYPRGGMPIDVFWQSDEPPEGLWLPPHGVPGYRGRG